MRIDGLENVRVLRDVKLSGASQQHQIDVLWEFTLGGVSHQTVVEAKHWRKFVGINEAKSFKGLLDDLPGRPHGILISSAGFQRGARRFAKVHSIQLCTLVPSLSALQSPLVAFHEVGIETTFECSSLRFRTSEGLVALKPPLESRIGKAYSIVGGGTKRSIPMLVENLMLLALSEDTETVTAEFFSDYFLHNSQIDVHTPVSEVSAHFIRHKKPRVIERDLRAFFSHVLSGLSNDETVLVAPDDRLIRVAKGAQISMCDFCGYPMTEADGENIFQSRSIVLRPLGGPIEGFTSQMMEAEWGACACCDDAIRAWDPDALVERYVEMAKYLPNAKSCDAARQIHNAFWLGYLKEQLQNPASMADSRFIRLAKYYEAMESADMDALDTYFGSEILDLAARQDLAKWKPLDQAQ